MNTVDVREEAGRIVIEPIRRRAWSRAAAHDRTLHDAMIAIAERRMTKDGLAALLRRLVPLA